MKNGNKCLLSGFKMQVRHKIQVRFGLTIFNNDRSLTAPPALSSLTGSTNLDKNKPDKVICSGLLKQSVFEVPYIFFPADKKLHSKRKLVHFLPGGGCEFEIRKGGVV